MGAAAGAAGLAALGVAGVLALLSLVSVLPWYVAVQRADRRGSSTVRAGLMVVVLLAVAAVAVLLGGLRLAPLLLLPWVAAVVWPRLPSRLVGTTGRHVVGSASVPRVDDAHGVRGDGLVAAQECRSLDP